MSGLVDLLRQRHHIWFQATVGFALLTVLFFALAQIDDRLFNGVNVWNKPFKFSLSFVAYFLTLVWFAPLLAEKYLGSTKGRVMTWLPVICAVFEDGYIAIQSGLGQASHYNQANTFHSAMYSLMGLGAVLLVVVCFWMGVSILRHRGFQDPYVFAVGLGLVLTFVLGGGFGGYMSAQTSHWLGDVNSDAGDLWFVHWIRAGGDLRVAHFFGIHAMQILLLAILPFLKWRRNLGFAIVVALGSGLTAFTTVTFVQTVRGIPFLA